MIQIDVERMAGKELVVRAKQFINEIDVRFRELAKDYDYLEKEYKGLKEKYEDLKQEESEPQYDYEAYNEGVAKGEQLMQEKVDKMLEFREHTKWEIIEDIFGTKTALVDFIININESYDKIMEYENEKKQEENEIHVGDEVVDEDGKKYIVRKREGLLIYLLEKSGYAGTLNYSSVSKTGKHYPIDEILKELE